MFYSSFTTLRFVAALIYEYAGYSPDDTVKTQMDSAGSELKNAFDVRDFRFLLSGQLKTKRVITWKAGIMYDGAQRSWFIRESGFTIATPEIWGHIFIGRTKEGISLSKVMSGYAIEGMERHMAIDAVPILADGIKWMGYLPNPGIVWNVGIYADWLSHGQSFSTYKWQFATRIAWLPIHSEAEKETLHIGGNFRLGEPVDHSIRVKSRPESNPAPFFVDTGTFESNQSTFAGGEVYYSSGPWMFGSEYYWQMYNAAAKGDPAFQGGEVVASYIFTGSSRPYTTVGGIYTYVPIKKSVFEGGWGEMEALIRFSTLDLDDGQVQGGTFWKITPMVNWYLSNAVRFEMAYGYGTLDRFNLSGATNFFQARVQLMIL
jgi:phosphate-selective porin OprO/OprP